MIFELLKVVPSIYKLFTSDDKDEAVKKITGQVVQSAAAALGIETTSKEEIVKHLEQNPDDVYKLKKLDNDFELIIKELDLKEKELQLEDKKESVKIYVKDPEVHKNLVWHINMQFYFSVVLGLITFFATAEYIDDKGLAMAISSFVSSIITLVANRVMNMDGFFFGSSLGSKEKDNKIDLMKGNG